MADVMTLEQVRDWHRQMVSTLIAASELGEGYLDYMRMAKEQQDMADAIDARMAETSSLREVARMALSAWDKDQDLKVGKLLRAMIDPAFAKNYMPGMHGLHAAQPAQEVANADQA